MTTHDMSATAIAKSSPVSCGAFIGLDSVDVSGGSYTDSYNSGSGVYPAGLGAKGTLCSNGKISLSGGGTVIHGDAHPGPGQTVSASGGSSVTGSKTPLTKSLSEAAVDPGNAALVNDNLKIPLSAQQKNSLINGVFNLSGGDSVTLIPGTYYFTKMTLSGGASVGITGKTIIYVNGTVDVSGGSLVNVNQKPSDLQLYPMGSKCTLSGSSQMYAVVYGPTADITRSGGSSDFFGMMVGASLTLSGGGGCHADTAVSGIGGSSRRATLVK
jgi:hypothetical protein